MPKSDANLLEDFVEQFQPPAIRADRVDLLALNRIYEQLPARFPRLYEQLLLNFMWDDVELPRLRLLANPGLEELLPSLLYDSYLAETLLPNGFLPFGRAPGGGYDPICFNTRARAGRYDCQIVRVDHEQILCNFRLKVREIVAPSFRVLAQAARGGTR